MYLDTLTIEVNNQPVSQPTYTPEKSDRDGMTISCRDISHINWKNGNTARSILLTPKCE